MNRRVFASVLSLAAPSFLRRTCDRGCDVSLVLPSRGLTLVERGLCKRYRSAPEKDRSGAGASGGFAWSSARASGARSSLAGRLFSTVRAFPHGFARPDSAFGRTTALVP